jgi:hypothetical protein
MITKKSRAQKVLESLDSKQALAKDQEILIEKEIELRRKELLSVLSKFPKKRSPAAR